MSVDMQIGATYLVYSVLPCTQVWVAEPPVRGVCVENDDTRIVVVTEEGVQHLFRHEWVLWAQRLREVAR